MSLFGKLFWSVVLLSIICLLGWVLLDFRALWLRMMAFTAAVIVTGLKGYEVWVSGKKPF